jgi:hypothetical protein
MIPRIYDTQRIALILGEDESQSNVTIDPNNPEAMTEYRDEMGEIKRIFNPNIGTYDIYTTTGPSFTTRRVEAVEAMTAMTQANPQLWQVIGDLLVKNMDWPGAEEMADRLKLTLLPAVQEDLSKDEGAPEIPPQMKQAMDQMQQQLEQMAEALGKAGEHVDNLEPAKELSAVEIEVRRIEANTKAYDAITKRLGVLGPLLNPIEVQQLAAETQREAMEQPDPGQPPSESMGIPEQLESPEQAPQGAFFTP